MMIPTSSKIYQSWYEYYMDPTNPDITAIPSQYIHTFMEQTTAVLAASIATVPPATVAPPPAAAAVVVVPAPAATTTTTTTSSSGSSWLHNNKSNSGFSNNSKVNIKIEENIDDDDHKVETTNSTTSLVAISSSSSSSNKTMTPPSPTATTTTSICTTTMIAMQALVQIPSSIFLLMTRDPYTLQPTLILGHHVISQHPLLLVGNNNNKENQNVFYCFTGITHGHGGAAAASGGGSGSADSILKIDPNWFIPLQSSSSSLNDNNNNTSSSSNNNNSTMMMTTTTMTMGCPSIPSGTVIIDELSHGTLLQNIRTSPITRHTTTATRTSTNQQHHDHHNNYNNNSNNYVSNIPRAIAIPPFGVMAILQSGLSNADMLARTLIQAFQKEQAVSSITTNMGHTTSTIPSTTATTASTTTTTTTIMDIHLSLLLQYLWYFTQIQLYDPMPIVVVGDDQNNNYCNNTCPSNMMTIVAPSEIKTALENIPHDIVMKMNRIKLANGIMMNGGFHPLSSLLSISSPTVPFHHQHNNVSSLSSTNGWAKNNNNNHHQQTRGIMNSTGCVSTISTGNSTNMTTIPTTETNLMASISIAQQVAQWFVTQQRQTTTSTTVGSQQNVMISTSTSNSIDSIATPSIVPTTANPFNFLPVVTNRTTSSSSQPPPATAAGTATTLVMVLTNTGSGSNPNSSTASVHSNNSMIEPLDPKTYIASMSFHYNNSINDTTTTDSRREGGHGSSTPTVIVNPKVKMYQLLPMALPETIGLVPQPALSQQVDTYDNNNTTNTNHPPGTNQTSNSTSDTGDIGSGGGTITTTISCQHNDSTVLDQLTTQGWSSDMFVEGQVVSVKDFGAYVRVQANQLNPNVHGCFVGLVHVWSMTKGRLSSVASIVKEHDKIQVRVKSILVQGTYKVLLSMISSTDEATKTGRVVVTNNNNSNSHSTLLLSSSTGSNGTAAAIAAGERSGQQQQQPPHHHGVVKKINIKNKRTSETMIVSLPPNKKTAFHRRINNSTISHNPNKPKSEWTKMFSEDYPKLQIHFDSLPTIDITTGTAADNSTNSSSSCQVCIKYHLLGHCDYGGSCPRSISHRVLDIKTTCNLDAWVKKCSKVNKGDEE